MGDSTQTVLTACSKLGCDPEDPHDFRVRDTVTDGECIGKVTRVFYAVDVLGNKVHCLSVRVSWWKEDFACTRSDWWRRV